MQSLQNMLHKNTKAKALCKVKCKTELSAIVLPATTTAQKMSMPGSLLNDVQSVLLAEIYKQYSCLWDETDIAYRFGNRRREAVKAVHDKFNKKTSLSLTRYDIGCEIGRLRKICSHEKRLKILCKQQNKNYRPSCKFYEHISYLEVDVTPYECSICGKISAGVCQYKVHVASHDGSLPFKCHVCGHGFKLTTNLSVHLRRHVHDYLYKCEVCSKPCATTTEIKIHMRSHTGEKPYVCDVCGKNFRTSSKINMHMRKHENKPTHRCEICNKGFYSKGFYREHMKVHQNVRDKICNICNKGFTSTKHLRQHKQIHAIEKKYACKICDKRFAQYAGLSAHMKSHGTTLVAASSKGSIVML
ncbi:zinc finger protein 239-like [Bactrocera tryoni]|uniref:zinc finger protein 239-like n=1 Tax=Bactrocera tryoni TaxID=59916 RepID=UPI001A97F7C6|nr:zinc finger protein 239-like [Bactrocera tryoni]